MEATLNKETFQVGECPFYTVYLGPENAPIHWSSMQNGLFTKEHAAFYGHRTDVNGLWYGKGNPFQESDKGLWIKYLHIGNNKPLELRFEVI